MKLLVALCIIAISYVSAEQRAVTLCGRQLATARVLVCYGSQYVIKRGENAILDNSIEDEIDWPWTGRRGALTANWSRYKREEGLADQCCLRPCTKEVIMNYC